MSELAYTPPQLTLRGADGSLLALCIQETRNIPGLPDFLTKVE